jgi:hypothetical protein
VGHLIHRVAEEVVGRIRAAGQLAGNSKLIMPNLLFKAHPV